MTQPGAEDWRPPEIFEEYRLLHPIGRGGMGQVFLGHDVLLDRPVAIKFIAAGEPSDAARQRFLIEARAIARLQHPNVVCVYRAGEVAGRPFLVSEYVRGRSLSRTPRPLPWRRALRIGLGLARGLGSAHRQGVLHRDIKPSNAMLTDDGEVKLLDFGVAKLLSLLPHPASGASLSGLPEGSAPLPLPTAAQLRERSGDGLRGAEELRGDAITPAPERGSFLRDGRDGRGPLTRDGAVLGTPLYMAPEVQAGAPATRKSDVYSLGVVLYELCTGRTPQPGQAGTSATFDLRARHDSGERGPFDGDGAPREPAPPLQQLVEGIDPRFAAAVERCLRPDPALRFDSGDELREALEQLSPELQSAVPAGNPYRGLLPFEAEHRALFFGRGPEIRAILERLRSEPMVLIAGDSGVGKSSLCRAGVLPLCADGALEDGRLIATAAMVPGKHPLLALAGALSPVLGEDERALAQRLLHEPSLPGLRLQQRQPMGLLLFIDQLEELLTLSEPGEAAAFDRVLGDLLLRHPVVRVLCTARADFLTRLAMLPQLGREMVRALYLLRPLSEDGSREAIVGPARRKDVAFESEALVDELVESAQAPGALPLLQFALAALWEARDEERRLIPASALKSVGGVAGALAAHADGVLLAMPPAQQVEARRLLTGLVTLSGTRARCTEDELGGTRPDAHRALEGLIRGRLVVARAAEGNTFYEVAHEALITGWGTLRAWLDADADLRAVRLRVTAASAEWERLGRTGEALWSERQLLEAQNLDLSELPPREHEFLRESRRASHTRRRARLLFFVGLPLLLAGSYGALRLKARADVGQVVAAHLDRATEVLQRARDRSREGARARERAQEGFIGASRSAGPDASDRDDRRSAALWQEAEAQHALALELDGEADAAYRRASQALEAALAQDFRSAPVRRMLAEVTFERVLLAERLRSPQRDELIGRLRNFDDGGRLALLEARAGVALRSDPPGAHVLLQRYSSGGPRRRLQPAGEAVADGNETAFLPGSYLLTFTLPGRTPVRLPLLITRGEGRPVSVSLPAQGEIPAGYVYVPPGRFLFGSGDDEALRKGFLSAPPLHEVATAGYLIGRSEVTFAEWIEFLRTLPAEERARRQPQAGQLQGELRLTEQGGAFQLAMQPTTQRYQAREGEPVRYGDRPRRAVQDWLRFPVSAVSFEDASAYAAWLASSGRLPGARLCSEHEWERAARGADDRIFPHGDRLLPEDANYDETYGRRPLAFGPDEVGSHPESESPFGVQDLAGNVLEWTRSVRRPGEAILRGGSWYHGELTNRSTNREVGEPTQHNILAGLRICAPFSPR